MLIFLSGNQSIQGETTSALSDDRLFQVKTALLRGPNLPTSQIAAQVEMLGHFTTTDGMIMDKNGNLYLGDFEKNAII